MHRYYKHKNRIYFSRWSRKSYSLFACLGKEVIISILKYKLTDVGMKIRRGSLFLLGFFVDNETRERDLFEMTDRFLPKRLISYMVSSEQSFPAAKSVDFYRKYRKWL